MPFGKQDPENKTSNRSQRRNAEASKKRFGAPKKRDIRDTTRKKEGRPFGGGSRHRGGGTIGRR
jgi:hypothetical protein